MQNPIKIAILGRGKWGTALKGLYKGSTAFELTTADKAEYLFLAKRSENCLDIFEDKISASNLIICSKGFFNEQLISDAIKERYKGNIMVLSGGNFSDEIEHGLPAEATLAGKGANSIANILLPVGSVLNLTPMEDIISAQIGGACKNIIAIACGAALKYGENFRAKIFRQGLADLLILNEALGGDNGNINQPAIIGDLFLSCASDKSRNMKFGKLMAAGRSKEDAISELGNVEGVKAVKIALNIAAKHGLTLHLFNATAKFIETGDINCLKEINS